MENVLRFKVEIEGLETKIWREIEIPGRRTLADLAYTILASFNSLAYHLYNINYNDRNYHCWIYPKDDPDYDKLINATKTKLSSMKLKENDTMQMEYDFGSPTIFIITYLESSELENFNDCIKYPNIVAGEGLGMLDDISEYDLKEIVDDTDKLGYSNHYFTPGYETNKKYDYRKYNINKDNRELKGKILAIKNGFEIED